MGPLADITALRDGEIHVWTTRLSDDEAVVATSAGVLDQDERARARQFRFERHRSRFIVSHALMRHVLARYAGVAAAELRFRYNPNGKPLLAFPASDPELHFSLSHSADCCMLAIRAGCPIGIDLEQLRELPDFLDIAHRWFSPAEVGLIAKRHGLARRDAFFALWTEKEAIAKALGANLADYLSRAEIDRSASRTRRMSATGKAGLRDRCSVHRLDHIPGYAAAIAGYDDLSRLTHFASPKAAKIPPQFASVTT